MRIWKYALPVVSRQIIEMPIGSQLLTVQTQADEPHLWALVDPGLPTEEREILMYGTGHPIDPPGRYIGTFQQVDGTLVFHVFDSR